ncbi:MAG: GMC oxidoreductase [Chloroflexota bacterium]
MTTVIRITSDIYDNEKRAWAYLPARAEEIMNEMGATNIWKPTASAARASIHAQGGTRMGDDPKRNVVDKWCAATRCPTGSSYNPTENIQALAWRGSEEIIR